MAPPDITVRLRKRLDARLGAGHPWVYRDALDAFTARPGDVVTVRDDEGRFVARGLADDGPIAARIWSLRDEPVSPALFAARVTQALDLRRRVVPAETDAYRVLHGENDRTPGFVCDVYGTYAVLALDGAGATAWRDVMTEALRGPLEARGVTALLVRTRREGGHDVSVAWGAMPTEVLSVQEHGMVLRVDLAHGQKTGLFLDQRDSRRRVRDLASELRVLNLYAYTGGFSASAGLGGARAVTSVDVAPQAIALADATWAANGLDPKRHQGLTADVQAFLADPKRRGARYDLVIADPPSFAPRESSVDAALKAYRALHQGCLGLLAPGGWYLAGSCSSHVDRARFLETLRDAASRARRVIQVVAAWGAPPDHPCLAAFPEGEYLKNVLVRVCE